jgi:diguanylate cyclase (GGDEF)-like protein/PAS domain S-box-containing protein
VSNEVDEPAEPGRGGSDVPSMTGMEPTVGDRGTEVEQARERALTATSTADCHALLDDQGRVVYVSTSVEKVMGFTPEEYAAEEPIERLHVADRAWARETWRELLIEPGIQRSWQARAVNKDGSYRWYEIVAVNRLDDPDLGGMAVGFTDITDRTGLSSDYESESRFEHLLRSSPDVIGSLSVDGTITWVSAVVHEMLGYTPDEMVGRSAFEFVHADDIDMAVERLASAFDDINHVDPVTVRLRHRDGSWLTIEVAGAPVLDPDGRIVDITINLRDVQWRQDALDALRSSERLFRSLAESSPTGIYQRDAIGHCTYVNERWVEITGIPLEDALGFGWRQIIHPDDLWLFDPVRHVNALNPRGIATEFRVQRPDGDIRWVSLRTAMLFDDEGPSGAIGAIEDITDRKQSQREMSRLIEIFEATADLIAITDTQGGLMYLNAAAKRFVGVEGDVDGLHVSDIVPGTVYDRLISEIMPTVESEGTWSGELSLVRQEGGVMPVWAQLLRHTDPEDEHVFYSSVLHDLSERKAFEHRLAHQATHDPLTGLPNRALLIDRLDGALARARRHGRRVAVLFLDLDHFKVVNDSLGHSLGDHLLIAISERLALALRPGDTVARFGGDEFVVLCEDVLDQADAVAVAERVDRAISGRFVVDETEVFVGVSIGIACPDDVDVDPETLIRDADAAMYRAKDRGRARWELFDNAMRAGAVDRLDIETALRRALDRRELRVYYQPIIELASGTIDGVEALLRWEHPERGLLNPDDFIAVAEETGLIVPIGAWVLDQACRQVQRWQASLPALPPLRVSVNLSGRQLGHTNLVGDVASVLAETGIDPQLVELEITESVLMDDVEMSQETLGQLHALGVKLVVDDFGTGYSSLSYLRRFPVDLLKVDKSFIDELGGDNGDSAIVTAIITLAHNLSLTAVAEGVETAGQLALLRELGCDRAQGFHMARPGTDHDTGGLLGSAQTW